MELQIYGFYEPKTTKFWFDIKYDVNTANPEELESIDTTIKHLAVKRTPEEIQTLISYFEEHNSEDVRALAKAMTEAIDKVWIDNFIQESLE